MIDTYPRKARLVLDVNWSGHVLGYRDRYSVFNWNDFCRVMHNRTVNSNLYNPPSNPNWRPPPKPRIRVIFEFRP